MKVVVSRSGGFTGIRITWEVQVEEQPNSSQWEKFLHDLPWDQVEDSDPKPDRFVYRIRCAPHEVVLSEPDVQGPWRELVDRVKAVNEGN